MFHNGEIAVHSITNNKESAKLAGQMVLDFVNPSMVEFIEKQEMIITATSNTFGKMWCSVLIGDKGFIQVKDKKTLTVNKKIMHNSIKDKVFTNIKTQSQIGILFFDPYEKKRYRVNGDIFEQNEQLIINVKEAYPNCPRYIHKRELDLGFYKRSAASISSGEIITKQIKKWITDADTFFLATQSLSKMVDASHRGGEPGFIQVEKNKLIIPDYPGNNLFNSLGNIYENPNCSILFINSKQKSTLHLIGQANLDLNNSSIDDHMLPGDTKRFCRFIIKEWVIQKYLD